jgi:hypothetical protein
MHSRFVLCVLAVMFASEASHAQFSPGDRLGQSYRGAGAIGPTYRDSAASQQQYLVTGWWRGVPVIYYRTQDYAAVLPFFPSANYWFIDPTKTDAYRQTPARAYSSYTNGGFSDHSIPPVVPGGDTPVKLDGVKPKPERPAANAQPEPKNLFDSFLQDKNQPQPLGPDARKNAQAEQDLIDALTRPTKNEIISGHSANVIIESLGRMSDQLKKTTAVPYDRTDLRSLNFTRGERMGSCGLLRDQGKITWPEALKNLTNTDEVKVLATEIEKKLMNISQQADAGKINPADTADLSKMAGEFEDAISAGTANMGFTEALQLRRFVKSLLDVALFLKQPDAADWMPRKCKVEVKTLQEAVLLLNDKHVRIAPALVGDERKYEELHAKLVRLFNDTMTINAEKP